MLIRGKKSTRGNKLTYYERKMAECQQRYNDAVDAGNTAKQAEHMREYLNYERMSQMTKGDKMIKPKNATHRLNGTYYQQVDNGFLFRPYSKVTGKLMSKYELFTKDNKPAPI